MLSATMRFATYARRTGFIIALLAFGSVVAFAGTRLDARRPPPSEGALIYLPQAKYLRPMSLGYNNVLANVLWFRTISYFGEHFRGDRSYRWLAHMCDLVTDLDPRADHVYRFAGVILPWEADQADEGIRLLQKGARTFPDSWRIHYWLGFNYYFFKNDFAQAASEMRRAAQLPGAHRNAAQMAAVLAAKHHGSETALQFLEELKREVDTEEMRQVVDKQIHEAQLALDLERLNAAVRAYREQHGRAPADLTVLIDANLLTALPSDPFGGVYTIDPNTGEVGSSTGHQPSRLHESKLRERRLRGNSAGGL